MSDCNGRACLLVWSCMHQRGSDEGCNWWVQWRGVMKGALEGCDVEM